MLSGSSVHSGSLGHRGQPWAGLPAGQGWGGGSNRPVLLAPGQLPRGRAPIQQQGSPRGPLPPTSHLGGQTELRGAGLAAPAYLGEKSPPGGRAAGLALHAGVDLSVLALQGLQEAREGQRDGDSGAGPGPGRTGRTLWSLVCEGMPASPAMPCLVTLPPL